MSFDQLGLDSRLERNLKRSDEIDDATSIQKEAIPMILEGHDVIAHAQTGSGKTLAYLLPTMQMAHQIRDDKGELEKRYRNPLILVIVPTHELTHQVREVHKIYGKGLRLRCYAVHGSSDREVTRAQDVTVREGIDTIVATPARAASMIEKFRLHVNQITHLILDEGDILVNDPNFLKDIHRIIQELPEERQTLVFSATFDEGTREKFQGIVKTNVQMVSSEHAGESIEQIDEKVIYLERSNKPQTLINLLQGNPNIPTIVFFNTKKGVEMMEKELERRGITFASIYKGKVNRQESLDAFKNGEVNILIGTDAVGRGIDSHVKRVINYDIPDQPEQYTHRIGRTGRAGFSGEAISLCDRQQKAHLEAIEKMLGKDISQR